MTAVKSLLEQARNPNFWRSLNPELSVSEDLLPESLAPFTVEPEQMKKLLLTLKTDGYFQIDGILPEADVLRMSAGVEKIRQVGWTPPFVFVYDEFWQTFCRLSQILSTVLGQDYQQLPDFWAWYIDPNKTETGWRPHRDKSQNTLLPDGMPKSLTVWIPLSDATPLNGCMYILPAAFDPNYGRDFSVHEIDSIQDIRALPAPVGSVLCWNQAVLHWGGRSSERATHPRLSFAFEFQRGDVTPYNTPLLDPSKPPTFSQRLGLIGKQILQYKHIYPLSEQLAELAVELKKMDTNEPSTNLEKSPSERREINSQTSELSEQIRQQFDFSPYPRTPLEESPKDKPSLLYIYNIVTPYYRRNRKIIDSQDKVILDAACGTGYKSLILAEANPGAKIVGVDLSEESVKLARQRLQYHGFDNTEFHVLAIEDLPSLEMEFDYINNDEMLYFLPDPVVGLQAMKSVLKPDGIIRTNLHSSFQRANFFRVQTLFKKMGVMEEEEQELGIELVRQTMGALRDEVLLKAQTWHSKYETEDELIVVNHLLRGDRGNTIPELFSALRAADLEFVSMVNWWQWDLMALFKDPDDLPVFLGMTLPELSVEEELHLFELLHPVNRLLDIWCGHPNQAESFTPISEWTNSDWQKAQIYLHPQLKTPKFKADLIESLPQLRMFEISKHLQLIEKFVTLDTSMAVCLLLLVEAPQSMRSLVERWQQVRPLNPVTLAPTDEEKAFYLIQQMLTQLERLGYVLLERQS
ncbi:methyltransferase domain-containing protein [Coleofasciculus sp.]|uniref:methyltransferase domain-containing protein n=1 Tax=Coleofasciculus sp. TaxID=3100458 RepID=UPI0040647ED6